jgi:hypothetical protein
MDEAQDVLREFYKHIEELRVDLDLGESGNLKKS